MFKANSGARIVITPTSGSRVWLEIPLPAMELSGVNIIEVSVEAADLEAAVERWKSATRERAASHA